MRTLTTMLLAFTCHFSLLAQNNCGSSIYKERLLQSDPALRLRLEKLSGNKLTNSPVSNADDIGSATPETIFIPVVVHVVYYNGAQNISEDQVKSQIAALNQDFNKENADISTVPKAFLTFAAKTNIRFILAKVDPDGRVTNGITRKKSTIERWSDDDRIKNENSGGVAAWDSRYYLNIWVSNLSGGLLGYSTFPGTPADKDGVVIRYDVFGSKSTSGSGSFNLGRTAVHEVGHWLNLKHLWGDTDCGSDDIDDTPQQRSYNRGCPVFPRLNKDCAEADPNGEMFMNFMDFTDDACMKMFTTGQSRHMFSQFSNGGWRHTMLASRALGEPYNFTPPEIADIAPSTMKLFPNPAADVLNFQCGKDLILGGKTFVVYGAEGRSVLAGILSHGQNSLSVRNLKPGLYFLRIGDGIELPVISFLKQ